MNRISINLKCGDSLTLTDAEENSQDELLENLSTLFSVNNVAILKVEASSVIIRPSDISSIQVDSLETTEEKKVSLPPPKKIEPKAKIVEDIITDMD